MAIEIVDFPIKNGDFPVRYVSHYQRGVGFVPSCDPELDHLVFLTRKNTAELAQNISQLW